MTFEEWEAEAMKDWRFRLWRYFYEPLYQWAVWQYKVGLWIEKWQT